MICINAICLSRVLLPAMLAPVTIWNDAASLAYVSLYIINRQCVQTTLLSGTGSLGHESAIGEAELLMQWMSTGFDRERVGELGPDYERSH